MSNATKVRIAGTVEFMNEKTGAYRAPSVSFVTEADRPWVDIVDEAVEMVYPTGYGWVATGEDTLSETEV